MQKVVGSSPIIRSPKAPLARGFSLVGPRMDELRARHCEGAEDGRGQADDPDAAGASPRATRLEDHAAARPDRRHRGREGVGGWSSFLFGHIRQLDFLLLWSSLTEPASAARSAKASRSCAVAAALSGL